MKGGEEMEKPIFKNKEIKIVIKEDRTVSVFIDNVDVSGGVEEIEFKKTGGERPHLKLLCDLF